MLCALSQRCFATILSTIVATFATLVLVRTVGPRALPCTCCAARTTFSTILSSQISCKFGCGVFFVFRCYDCRVILQIIAFGKSGTTELTAIVYVTSTTSSTSWATPPLLRISQNTRIIETFGNYWAVLHTRLCWRATTTGCLITEYAWLVWKSFEDAKTSTIIVKATI